jgi:hypothetical protein
MHLQNVKISSFIVSLGYACVLLLPIILLMKFLLRIWKIHVHVQINVLNAYIRSIIVGLIQKVILELRMLKKVVVGLESRLIYNGSKVGIYCVTVSLDIEIIVRSCS